MSKEQRKKLFCEECEEDTLHRYCPRTPETHPGWECMECESGFTFEEDGLTYEPDEVAMCHSDADPGL